MTESSPENPRERVAELERRLSQMHQAATLAESNELRLHRRLSPYLDAEIENRDREIEDLKARLREQDQLIAEECHTGEEAEHGD